MDRRERSGDLLAGLLALLDGWQTGLWTAMPGIIQSFNADERTVQVQPSIKGLVTTDANGGTQWQAMPLLVDCPVVFPQGGGVTLTFPLALGDECLVVFASRCIDSWWQSGGVQVQAEMRLHDLSDGFAIAGIRSKPNVEAAIRTDRAELRTLDGTARISLYPSTKKLELVTTGDISATAGGNVSVSGANVLLDGTASVVLHSGLKSVVVAAGLNSNVNGGLTIDSKAFGSHVHGGVAAGGSNTGAPV